MSCALRSSSASGRRRPSALAFVLPTTWLTLAAYVYAREAGVLGPRYPGGVAAARRGRGAARRASRSRCGAGRARRSCAGLRETVPLLACFLIYTNLHDTIGFVNPHDVHHALVALDARDLRRPAVRVGGAASSRPARTELMQFLYLNFFWIAPVDERSSCCCSGAGREFRAATLGVVTCFFVGYAALRGLPGGAAAARARPRVHEEPARLPGRLLERCRREAFSLLPVDSRAAFPSLHTAASLVALVYAWRYAAAAGSGCSLPFVVGLWVSTIYLRHHYFVDLVGRLGRSPPVAAWLAPRVDAWWAGSSASWDTSRPAERDRADAAESGSHPETVAEGM